MAMPQKSEVARSVPFDNASNGFSSVNVQDAIEEAQTVAILKPRYSITTTHNGTISNNQWLGYDNLLPGDAVPIVNPINATLREISFSFSNSNVDGVFHLYKNGTSGGNIILSITFTNVTGSKLETGINLPLSAGDLLRGRWEDTGDNPSDMALVYFMQVV